MNDNKENNEIVRGEVVLDIDEQSELLDGTPVESPYVLAPTPE